MARQGEALLAGARPWQQRGRQEDALALLDDLMAMTGSGVRSLLSGVGSGPVAALSPA